MVPFEANTHCVARRSLFEQLYCIEVSRISLLRLGARDGAQRLRIRIESGDGHARDDNRDAAAGNHCAGFSAKLFAGDGSGVSLYAKAAKRSGIVDARLVVEIVISRVPRG
jgi:hypothetical protein